MAERIKKIDIKLKDIDNKLVLISFLMFMDFIFTWIGIRVDFIIEGNPFMVWLFKLNFIQGCIVRTLMIFIIVYIINKIKKENYKVYKQVAAIAISANIFVLNVHCAWIFSFLSQIVKVYS